MYGYFKNATENGFCGVVTIKEFTTYHPESVALNGTHVDLPSGTNPARGSISLKNLKARAGARLLACGFNSSETSKAAYKHIVTLLGAPAFESEERNNTFMGRGKKDFKFCVWDFKNLVEND